MLRFSYLYIASLIIVLLYGCTQNNTISLKDINADECFFPDAPKESAPKWVCGTKVTELAVQAVGSAKIINNSHFTVAKTQAQHSARADLTRNIKSDIAQKISSYSEQTDEDIKQINTIYTREISQLKLMNAKEVTYKISPNNIVYVLVGLLYNDYGSIIKNLNNKAINNSQASLLTEIEALSNYLNKSNTQ